MVSCVFNSVALELGTVCLIRSPRGHRWSSGNSRMLEKEDVVATSVVKEALRAPATVSVNSILNRFWSLCGRKPHLRWADLSLSAPARLNKMWK